jgi:hypothetical protein
MCPLVACTDTKRPGRATRKLVDPGGTDSDGDTSLSFPFSTTFLLLFSDE